MAGGRNTLFDYSSLIGVFPKNEYLFTSPEFGCWFRLKGGDQSGAVVGIILGVFQGSYIYIYEIRQKIKKVPFFRDTLYGLYGPKHHKVEMRGGVAI